jgi:hypothetical protein
MARIVSRCERELTRENSGLGFDENEFAKSHAKKVIDNAQHLGIRAQIALHSLALIVLTTSISESLLVAVTFPRPIRS